MTLVSKTKTSSLRILKDLAVSLGVNDVRIISSSDIIVSSELAGLCKDGCKNYGLSLSCPPNVGGPCAFKQWQKISNYTLVVRIDVPCNILFSSERLEVMRLLHEIVSNVEQKAKKIGYFNSRSFAGGSCKEIFCSNYMGCNVLSAEAKCRNEKIARPSMSGFGIDVGKLMSTSDWKDIATKSIGKYKQETTWLVGIVMVA